MDCKYVKLEKKGAIRSITYHSDKEQNLLTIQGMQEILWAIEECRYDENCRALLFTGWGDCFCMGGYLGDYKNQGAEKIIQFADMLTELHKQMSRFPKPTVAAVNGHTGGGGLSFLETFDMAVSVPWAEFSLPERQNGLAPMISLMGMQNSFSRKICMELAGLGTRLHADQAMGAGIINRIAENDVMEEAAEYAMRLSDCNIRAFGVCKQFYVTASGLSYEQQLEIGKQYLVTMLKSKERMHT